jgi:molybdopterin-guanine dinucleotide biosynthesis protein A
MGEPKAWIDWNGVPLLTWICEVLGPVARPLVVVHAAHQDLPPLPAGVEHEVDERADRGPLGGMATGLRALAGRADAVVVASCDLPLLHADFVRALADRLAGHDAAVAVADGREQVLCGVYRTAVLPKVDALLAANSLRVRALLDHINVLRVAAADLPHSESVCEVNTPQQLDAARAEGPA